MLLNKATLQGIANGSITLVFRRWTKPTVKSGGHLRTRAGQLEIETVEKTSPRKIMAEDALRAGYASKKELIAFLNARESGDIYRITVGKLGDDPRVSLRKVSALNTKEMTAVLSKLDRLDKVSRHGDWTRQTLSLISAYPARLAQELATEMDLEKPVFKRNVRKLKEMGLTESLKVGYRLSPRGQTVFQAIEKH